MASEHADRLRVVVLDGDPSFRDALADAFGTVDGVAVETATGTGAAVERVRGDSVDGVVVGDAVEAPLEAVERLDERADCPVVLVTGAVDDPETVAAAVEAGAADYFPRTTATAQYELLVERIAAERHNGARASDDARSSTPDRPGGETTDGADAGAGLTSGAGRAYREVFENVGDGLVIHDPDSGEILDVNERFCELNGYDRAELVGETIDLVTATDEGYGYEAAQERIERAAAEGPQLFEWRNRRKDGETFPVEVHLAVVRVDGVERVLASVRDITERRQREREYEQVFDGVNDAIVIHDPETGEMVDANETFCDLVGYDRERVLELGTAGLSVTEEGYTEARAESIIEEVVETGSIEPFEWKVETADGTERLLEVTATRAEIGGETRHLSLMRDITERRQREREYEQVFDGVNDAIAVFDPETGDIVDVNDTYHELLGYDDLATIRDLGIEGLSVTEAGYTGERGRELIREVAETGEPTTVEWRGERQDGERLWLEATLAPAEIGGEQRVLSMQRDVTERKRREREFEQIFNGVQGGITINDPETGEFLEVNDSLCELLGYSREALLDLGVEGISDESYGFTLERAREIIREVVDSGEPRQFEWAVETSDGETRWLDVRGTTAEIGGQRRYLSLTRDITERKRREREYEQIYNGVQDGLQIMDPDTLEILDVNEAYLEMFGYDSLDAVRGQGVEGLSAVEEGFTPEKGRAVHQRVVETGEPELLEWRAETADGEWLWLELKITPAIVGGEQRTIVVHRDITDRKRRERIVRTLHESTDDLQNADTAREVCEAAVAAAEDVLDLSMPACWLADEDGTLEPVAAGEAAQELSGAPRAFEPGSHLHDAYRGEALVVYDPREHREGTPFRRAFLVPLGDHGLLGAAEPDVASYDEVTLDAARILARHARSALDRVERARELRESERRFRTIAERVEEIIYMANADLTEVEYVNPAYADVYGRPVDALYEDARAFFEGVHPDDVAGFEADVEAMLSDVASGDPADSYEFAYRVERPDGEIRWVEATGYPILDDAGDPHRYVAVAEDVTERERREATLETFHEATRELTAADSREAAARQAVRAADEVLGFPLVSAHLYDDETGRLEPVATTDRLAALDVEPPAFGPGDSLPWQVYVEGESTTSTGDATGVYGPGVSGPDVVLPLGSHGVMLVGGPAETFDGSDVELAQILAATLEASLNHVAGERALAEREAQLEREQARAERLQRLNDIIRDIEQATIERSARAGIEAAVCERLVEVEGHDLVWVAEPAVGGSELLPRTSDGDREQYVDALSLDAGGAGGHPAVAAYREAESRTVASVATEIAGGDWRTTALQHGIQSVVAVPIRHENTVHGVLAVESTEPDAFDDAIREVLAELGRSIGYAITVTEREQALESEGTTELEFAVDDEGLFMIRAAREGDCRVELERTIRRSGGSFSTFYGVEGADPSRLVELANAAASVERAQVASTAADGDGGLVEVSAPTWFGSVFTDHGAVVREAAADADGGTLVVEAPRGANVRALVEGFAERYPGAELVAQRQRERTVRSLFELQDTLADELTDRQWEALETAYSAGYFAWPRETSGQEVAELLGVTQPTFNKHLRVAERTAFRILLDREYPEEE